MSNTPAIPRRWTLPIAAFAFLVTGLALPASALAQASTESTLRERESVVQADSSPTTGKTQSSRSAYQCSKFAPKPAVSERPALDEPEFTVDGAGDRMEAVSWRGPNPSNPQTDSTYNAPWTAALLTDRARNFFTDHEDEPCLNGTYGAWYDYNNTFRCTGTLIDPEWVLTAAHCVSNYSRPSFSDFTAIREVDLNIRLGSSAWNSGGQVYDVVETHIHPDWTRQVFSNGTWINDSALWTADLALLKLDSPAPYNDAMIQAVSGNDWEIDQKTRGWGVNEIGDSPTQRLWWYSDLVSDSTCAATDMTGTYNGSESLCFDVLDGFGACYGDSGSSIGTIDNGYNLTGVASYMIFTGAEGPDSSRCDDPRLVAYTHITGSYLSWLQGVIN